MAHFFCFASFKLTESKNFGVVTAWTLASMQGAALGILQHVSILWGAVFKNNNRLASFNIKDKLNPEKEIRKRGAYEIRTRAGRSQSISNRSP